MNRDPFFTAAAAVHAALIDYHHHLRSESGGPWRSREAVHDCLKQARRYSRAIALGWHGAARRIRRNLAWSIDDARQKLDSWRPLLNQQEPKLPTLRQLLGEIHQLADDFGTCEYDRKTGDLVAITDSINLEGYELGRFEIRLSLRPPDGAGHGYPGLRIVALEAQPAAGDSHVPHPHVSGEQLCAGEGLIPMRQAALDGRLADFFLIVRSVLETYNPESAYVTLSDWEAASCTNCGNDIGREDAYSCVRCQDALCDECAYYCQSCDDPFCCTHSLRCEECETTYCELCAREALVDGRCDSCREDDEDEPEEDENDENQEESCYATAS